MTSYLIETVRTKCIIGEALKVSGQKYDKLSLKIVQKALKWPLQYANFQKISEEVCPWTPLESFLAVKLLKINSAGKIRLKKVTKIDAPFLKMILKSEDAPDMQHLDRVPKGFIQVNDGKRFDHIKTCTLTGTFKIFIAAGVDPGISPLNYPF